MRIESGIILSDNKICASSCGYTESSS